MERLKKIMLVDDDDVAGFLTKMIIDNLGIAESVVIAMNGKEAIELLEQEDYIFPDIIFLDINMPIMDGFDFLNAWERNGMETKSKIVMFSSSLRPSDRKQALEFFDVVDYIEKPMTEDKIKELIRNLYPNFASLD